MKARDSYVEESFWAAIQALTHLRYAITSRAAGDGSLVAYEDFREAINKAEGMLYVSKRDYDAKSDALIAELDK
jgi:hypothetical protein